MMDPCCICGTHDGVTRRRGPSYNRIVDTAKCVLDASLDSASHFTIKDMVSEYFPLRTDYY